MNTLCSLTEKLVGRRVVVLGDLVADVFSYGEIARISREAPVLILNHRETQLVPGGGANAIHNLRTLGADPIPVGVVGNDAEGYWLSNSLSKLGIDVDGIVVSKSYRTPTKTRILAGAVHAQRQQIVRMDSGAPLDDAKTHRLIERQFRRVMKNADALLISDYGYGLVTPALLDSRARTAIPVTIDSRFSLGQFVGLTAATPNESEVEATLGISIGNDLSKLEWAGRTLLRKLKHEAVLITRGKSGMALFERGKKTQHLSIRGSDEVADVTGAGDTVIATFTLALAAGAAFRDAAELANFAGGIVVMKYGTRPVFFEELVKAVDGTSR
jgi:D-glycero-beta-D-manno-heptose-7-phosphate kinase